MSVAAVYMISGNLLFVMAIHALWDIVVKIARYFIDGYHE